MGHFGGILSLLKHYWGLFEFSYYDTAWLAEQNVALERELRDARRSLLGAGPTTAPCTSTASVEGLVVVVPTPTGPTASLLSSRLAACAISLRASGSNVGGCVVYLRVEDTPPPSRSQC